MTVMSRLTDLWWTSRSNFIRRYVTPIAVPKWSEVTGIHFSYQTHAGVCRCSMGSTQPTGLRILTSWTWFSVELHVLWRETTGMLDSRPNSMIGYWHDDDMSSRCLSVCGAVLWLNDASYSKSVWIIEVPLYTRRNTILQLQPYTLHIP